MSLVVAIQMDPIDSIDIKSDSTFILALEAQARGHLLYHYLPQELSDVLFYHPTDRGLEQKIGAKLEHLRYLNQTSTQQRYSPSSEDSSGQKTGDEEL